MCSGETELARGAGPDGVVLRTGPSVDVTGEAVTNNRKGKLIPSYELHVKGTFSGVSPAYKAGCSTINTSR